VITAHRNRLSVRELLAAAYKQEANEKAALFRILGELATDNDLPELVGRLNGKDPVARLHIINILSRFPKPEVSRALQQQLKDNNKLIAPRRWRRWRAWKARSTWSCSATCCSIRKSTCRTRPSTRSSARTTRKPSSI
jgi:hypothetical protein